MCNIQDEIKANGKCQRCNGKGILEGFKHVRGGVCFACWGIGYKVTVTEDVYTLKPGDLFGMNGVLFKVQDIIWKNTFEKSELFFGTMDLVGNQSVVLIRVKDGKRCNLPRIEISADQCAHPAENELIGKSIF